MENHKKVLELLSFYKKQADTIGFRLKIGTSVFGEVESLPGLMGSKESFVMKLEDNSLMKIFLEDVQADTIFPYGYLKLNAERRRKNG